MIKAVLFDYDGTIVDTNEIILKSWRHLYMKMIGRECTDDEVLGSFGEELGQTLLERFPDEDVDEMIDIFRSYQRGFFLDELKLYPGMKELIVGLKDRGIKTAVVTSRGKYTTSRGLNKFGLDDILDFYITSEDTNEHKPSPVPCLIALDRLGVKADEAIMIGDSRYDIHSAHNASVKAVLVNWTLCFPEEFRVGIRKPDWIIDTPGELFDIIDNCCD